MILLLKRLYILSPKIFALALGPIDANVHMLSRANLDNSFVYFQPGNGKLNIKEPKELAKKAMKQIQQAIDLAKEG